jgi:hypothetical protein
MCCDYSPNEEFVLSASLDNSVRVYFAKTGRMKHNLMGHVGRVFTAKFSADSKQVAWLGLLLFLFVVAFLYICASLSLMFWFSVGLRLVLDISLFRLSV